MTLKQLINSTNNVLDFWTELENNGGELLFEEYSALYLKATLPGDTYWLGEEVVPSHLSQKYDFAKILKGMRSIGADVVNLHNGRAVGYESKWFKRKETIRFKEVANKLQVIQKTGIDQLIFTTNARKASDMVIEFADEAAFMFQEDWLNEDVYKTVKEYINTQKVKTYNPITPRDEFFQTALDELKDDVDNFNNFPVRIFQHWPAASGKGSFPRLAYDMIFEPCWDFNKAYPINAVINPTLTVLKGNLLKLIEHDLALKNNVVHAIYAGDVTKAAKDTEELQTIRTLAKVFTNKVEFVKFIRETNDKTVWVHTTVHSYNRLAKVMKGQKKSFYFAHIDEVHHMIQPDYSTWTASLKDSACKIDVRFMSSANKRKARGNGATYSMDDPNFCNIMVKDLDEGMAVKLGYKRQTVMLNYVYDDNSFPTDWIEQLEQNGQPLVKLKDTDIVVPMSWFMAVDSLFRFRVEYPERKHTKITLNSIKECVEFKNFIEAIRPKLLRELAHSNNPVYRRLLKAKVMVADTHENSTVKLLKKVSAIPDTFIDSIVIHCLLLGEGWDPDNGWIDSNMFVSPTHSEIRIYQDVNRGSRIGDGTLNTNYVVQFFLKEKEEHNHFNDMFARVKYVGEVLEVGVDDITEKVVFKQVKSIRKGKPNPRSNGSDTLTYYDEIDADFFANSFDTYIKEGRYHKFGGTVNDMFTTFHRMFKERMGWLHPYIKGSIYQYLVDTNSDFFIGYVSMDRKYRVGRYKYHYDRLAKIVKGEHWLLSDENVTLAINYAIDYENKKQEYLDSIVADWKTLAGKIAYPVSRKLGVLNSTNRSCNKGKWPVHQLNQIKQRLDEQYQFTKYSVKKAKDYPSAVGKLIKDCREEMSNIWKGNMTTILNQIVDILSDQTVTTNEKLTIKIEENVKDYNTSPATSYVSLLLSEDAKSKDFYQSIDLFDINLSNKLKNAVIEFKNNRTREISDDYKIKLKNKTLQKNINKVLDSKVIEHLNKTANKYRSTRDWVEDAAIATNLKYIYIKQKLFIKGNILKEINHPQEEELLNNAKMLKFRANSDIHKGKKSWNSGLGERNGQEKCKCGKQTAYPS